MGALDDVGFEVLVAIFVRSLPYLSVYPLEMSLRNAEASFKLGVETAYRLGGWRGTNPLLQARCTELLLIDPTLVIHYRTAAGVPA